MKVWVVFMEQRTVLWFVSIVRGDKFMLNLMVDGVQIRLLPNLVVWESGGEDLK